MAKTTSKSSSSSSSKSSSSKSSSRSFVCGDVVRSKVNPAYKGTYIIVKTKATVCWVKFNLDSVNDLDPALNTQEIRNKIYKGIPYGILEKVNQ